MDYQRYHKENLKYFELKDKYKIKCQNLGDIVIQRNFSSKCLLKKIQNQWYNSLVARKILQSKHKVS